MQDEANYTIELLEGKFNKKQYNLLKVLLEDENNRPILDTYLLHNTINRGTRDSIINDDYPADTPLKKLFMDVTDKVYAQVNKKITPLKFDDISQKLKDAETELAECKSVINDMYLTTVCLIRSNSNKLENWREDLDEFKASYEKYYNKYNKFK